MTVLSLTWESPYLGKTIFILKRGPAIPADYILEVVVIIQFPFTFMAVDGLVTQGAMASVAMIASLLTVPNLCMADASLGAQQHIKILRLICINLFFCLNFNILFTYTVHSISLSFLQRTHYEWDMVSFVSLLSEQSYSFPPSVLYNIIVLYVTAIYWEYIDCLKQDFSISNALAMEIFQSCTKPLIWHISTRRDIFQ